VTRRRGYPDDHISSGLERDPLSLNWRMVAQVAIQNGPTSSKMRGRAVRCRNNYPEFVGKVTSTQLAVLECGRSWPTIRTRSAMHSNCHEGV